MKKFIFFAHVYTCITLFLPFSVSGQDSLTAYPNYVVIGAFAIRQNAIEFTDDANTKKFPAKFEMNLNRNLYYVYVLTTDDRPFAFAEALRLRTDTKYFDTWVYSGPFGDAGFANATDATRHQDFNPETGGRLSSVSVKSNQVRSGNASTLSLEQARAGDASTLVHAQKNGVTGQAPASQRGIVDGNDTGQILNGNGTDKTNTKTGSETLGADDGIGAGPSAQNDRQASRRNVAKNAQLQDGIGTGTTTQAGETSALLTGAVNGQVNGETSVQGTGQNAGNTGRQSKKNSGKKNKQDPAVADGQTTGESTLLANAGTNGETIGAEGDQNGTAPGANVAGGDKTGTKRNDQPLTGLSGAGQNRGQTANGSVVQNNAQGTGQLASGTGDAVNRGTGQPGGEKDALGDLTSANNDELSGQTDNPGAGQDGQTPGAIADGASERENMSKEKLPPAPKRTTTEPLTKEEVTGKNFYFHLFRADNRNTVAGEVDAIDFEKSRKMATYEANTPVKVIMPSGATKQISFVCQVFGYRKQQQEFDPNGPDENFYLDDKENVVVPFELVRLQKGDIAIMYNVFFFKDAAVMRPESRYEVNNLLDLLVENPSYKIRIHGHTNGSASGKIIRMDQGGNFYSLSGTKQGFGSAKELSEERANVIREFLISSGVAADRMDVRAWGGKKPIHDKHSVRANENVRVEIEILSE